MSAVLAPIHARTAGAAAARATLSIVLPAFNEAAVIQQNLGILCDYLATLADRYDYEILVINDGSRDDTSTLAHAFAAGRPNVFVFDHPTNFGLGQAMRSAFRQCSGDVIVVMDADLSYEPKHIEKLADKLLATKAKVVIASPYLYGGSVENVPPLRRWLSVAANKLLSMAAHGRVHTLTGMVRAYDARFLASLDFYSMGMEVNSEILYKAMVLRARIEEVPAVLKWHAPPAGKKPVRRSSMRIVPYLRTLLVTAYLYRPILFFLLPALAAIAVAPAAAVGAVLHPSLGWAVLAAVGVLGALQLLVAGILATQNKCYFEQSFHLGTTAYRLIQQGKKESL